MTQPPDWNAMMQQAQAMQQRMVAAQEAARQKTVEASAGGGMVTVTVSGGLEVKRLKIDPQAIDPKDLSMLEDLVVAALNQALAKAQELQASELQSVVGASGLNIPGLF
jgi:DNA-binding YbaB/EbfC family protein